ncbi:phosphoglycerate mutase family protein [Thiomicrorhabdus sp.]|uniref:histidine phosphatase family protein n=1 Tax=Thiomicrorhabdus sp. TaxID=2039724 RepID=UPI0029C61695|nr:phosphoglycerate mutase family protein [Thiomicrorhabdus sp.]
MNKLYLAFLRHGDYLQKHDTPSAWQPFALTEQGEKPCRSAATKLRAFADEHGLDIHASVQASSLLRAWQTASIIAGQLGEEFSVASDASLNERCVGSFANMTVTEIETALQQDPRFAQPPASWKSDSDYRLPCPFAESLNQAGQRVAEYLQQRCFELQAQITAPTLWIVCGHGASFRHAAQRMGILQPEEIPLYSMYHAEPLFFEWQQTGLRLHSGDWKRRDKAKYSPLID